MGMAMIDRRTFLRQAALGTVGVVGGMGSLTGLGAGGVEVSSGVQTGYRGPNVILVRFGGGVRRQETIDPRNTYAPYFCHELIRRGTFFPKMEIQALPEIETSHGQGTLYLLTGKYDRFKDIGNKFLGQRFEPKVPTLFEYLRKAYQLESHEALIVNGEDRKDEEFYNFSNHTLYGVDFRSTTLSLHRFKSYLLRRQLAEGKMSDRVQVEKEKALRQMEALDYRTAGRDRQVERVEAFWEHWREHYGETGFVNPRGDRLLTELTLRAMKELRPRLVMINYNDPDYVHWGNLSHYTRGISIIDEGIKQLVQAVEADPFYRDNTVFAIVPDCGRDTNPFVAVPCQHHFNSKSAREIFGLFMGPGIPKGKVVDRRVEQISVTSTLGRLMGVKTPYAEGSVLEEVWS
jgi:hypothetical protein